MEQELESLVSGFCLDAKTEKPTKKNNKFSSIAVRANNSNPVPHTFCFGS
ncbi:MAG: hypothetical protein KKF44_11320 [Nanoarchaeota archaeon]|nr:hypothetical protein [Nanoarchaeota archaeon]